MNIYSTLKNSFCASGNNHTKMIVLLICFSIFNYYHIVAQPGMNDASFTPGSAANGNVSRIILQPDGKSIVTGVFTTFNTVAKRGIVRLNTDGTVDGMFSGTGVTGATGAVVASAIQADGKILIGGNYTAYNGTARNRICRINTDGTIDNTFTIGAGANNWVYAIATQSDGKIIIGGLLNGYGVTAVPYICRLNTNGSLDATFNTGGSGANNYVYSISIQSDDKIIIGGYFTTYNGVSRRKIARLNADGTLDNTFNPGTAIPTSTCVVYSTECQSTGKTLIGGNFTSFNGVSKNHLARLNSNGSLDTTLVSYLDSADIVYSTNTLADGRMIIGGRFSYYSGVLKSRIALLNDDGSLNTSFQGNGASGGIIYSTALQADGGVLLGGAFTAYTGVARSKIARAVKTCSIVNVSLIGQTNNTCFGNTNGTATVSATGGTSFTYSWSPGGGTLATNSNMSSGTYTCIVTNECSETKSITVTITSPTSITIAPLSNTTVCSGANTLLFASATGGTGAINYIWQPGNLSGPSQSVNPNTSTVYTVNVNDANNCQASATQSVTVTNCPGPVLTAGSCGVTLSALDQTLNFTSISGATNYRLEITNPTQPFSAINIRSNNLTVFKMSYLAGIQYGRTYNIRIAAYVGNAWQSYGNSCTVTTPASTSIPTTNLNAGSCGITLSTLDQSLNFSPVSGATNYRFEIINASQPLNVVNVRNNTSTFFQMLWVAGVRYGTTYDVRISAYVNGVWQAYGASCQITTPASIPPSQMVASSCNITVSSQSQILNFTSVQGATKYRVEVINAAQPLNVVNIRNTTLTTFALSYVSGIQPNRTYDLRVAANVGGVWGPYGAVCQVSTPASMIVQNISNTELARISQENIEENGTNFIKLYPNPTFGKFFVESSQSIKEIFVYNISGQLILKATNTNEISLSDFESGLYMVTVITEKGQRHFKIVKE